VLAILNSLGAGEAIAILVIALIVLGPEKLPDAIRKFGNIYGELRRMSHGFQSELRDAFDEPLRELRGTAQMMQDAVNEPVKSVKSAMTAPVVGGGKPAETTKKGPADETQAPAEETQTPVEETQAPAEETQTAVEETQARVEETQAPVDEDEGQPVLAQAGLMVSEPELAVVAGNGAADGDGAAGEGDDEPSAPDSAAGAGGAGDGDLVDGHRDD
jgi:sec-independent protein translocase protein TatB